VNQEFPPVTRRSIVGEPSQEGYAAFIHYMARWAGTVRLVVRSGLGLSDRGADALRAMHPSLIEQSEASDWPGTRLLDATASIYTFAADELVVGVLIRGADRLYEWQQPQLPEDLGFDRPDGSVLLVTISHEHDGYIEVSPEELELLTQRVPA
jgi:hypothetical protein